MPSLLQRLKERKLFQWALAYLAGAWLIFQGIEVLAEPWSLSAGFQQVLHVLLGIGFLVTLVLAWYHGEKGRQRASGIELLILAGILVIAGAAVALLGRGEDAGGEPDAEQTGAALSVTDPKSVAVLPFLNVGGDPDNEYFSDGITFETINHLSRIADLKVISRTSIMQYKGTQQNLRQIGQELDVATVLEGEIQRVGDRVRINVQLIDANSDEHLWAEQYNRELTDVFAIQSDVARHIASALRATLTLAERDRIERQPTENLAAYDLYMRGLAFESRGLFEIEPLRQAERLYRQALEVDPGLAVAWAHLSKVHSSLYWAYIDRSAERLASAREAFERAFEIDSSLPEAHTAAGLFYYYGSRDYESALREFEAALATKPNDVDALTGIAWVYRRLGEWEQAVRNLERASGLDPRSSDVLLSTGETLYYYGRYEDAERYFLRALATQSGWAQPLRLQSWLYTSWQGDVDRARSLLAAALDADTVGVLPGADDLQSWWLLRVLGDDAGRLLEHLAPATFDGDTVAYLLAVAELEWRRDGSEAAMAAYASAAEILERQLAAEPGDPRYHSELGVVLAGLGRNEEAIREGRRAVELLPASRDALWGRAFVENLALIYVRVAESEAALDQLERLPAAGPVTSAWLRVDPLWDPLRDQPRFQALLDKYE